MREQRIIIPGVSVIERMAGEAMHAADVSVTNDVHVLIDNEQRALLESLLSEKTQAQQSRLSWLRDTASRVGGRSLLEILAKIELMRSPQSAPIKVREQNRRDEE